MELSDSINEEERKKQVEKRIKNLNDQEILKIAYNSKMLESNREHSCYPIDKMQMELFDWIEDEEEERKNGLEKRIKSMNSF